MAEHKVIGGTMYLYISPTNNGVFDTVICLETLTKDDSVGEVDASSQCGPDISPGELSLSRTFDGQHMQDPDTGEISGTDLRILMYAKTLVGYKIATIGLVAGDETETGEGYITALSSTYAFNDVGRFSGTLRPSGTPVIVTES